MKIMIIGARGQLGQDLVRVFEQDELLCPSHEELDVDDYDTVRDYLRSNIPEFVIDTAAYHIVPECEKEPERSFRVNAFSVRNLSSVCNEIGASLVYISTDYVFDGKKQAPYDENDLPSPLNIYGVSKLLGECFARWSSSYYIVRVSSLFGVAGCRAKGGGNFVETMLNIAKNKNIINVTANIVCSPTYTLDAARQIKHIIENKLDSGIYHVANNGECSWFDFAEEIFRQENIDIKLIPKEETQDTAGVKRPLYSVIKTVKLRPMRDWREALSEYLRERRERRNLR